MGPRDPFSSLPTAAAPSREGSSGTSEETRLEPAGSAQPRNSSVPPVGSVPVTGLIVGLLIGLLTVTMSFGAALLVGFFGMVGMTLAWAAREALAGRLDPAAAWRALRRR